MKIPPVTWYTIANLNTGANRLIQVGGGEHAAAQLFIGDVRSTPNLRFSLIADQVLTIDLESAFDFGFTVTGTELSLITVANVFTTVYSLPAPLNGTGYYVLTRPYLRVRLTNASGVNTTSLLCTVTCTGDSV